MSRSILCERDLGAHLPPIEFIVQDIGLRHDPGAMSLALPNSSGLCTVTHGTIYPRNASHAGQMYIPFIIWTLYAGCAALVLAFGSAASLSSAYGFAVSGVMLITSLAMLRVARLCWRWGKTTTGLLWACSCSSWLLGGGAERPRSRPTLPNIP